MKREAVQNDAQQRLRIAINGVRGLGRGGHIFLPPTRAVCRSDHRVREPETVAGVRPSVIRPTAVRAEYRYGPSRLNRMAAATTAAKNPNSGAVYEPVRS